LFRVRGPTLPHHNGRTEGVNTRTKMVKRQMYGRVGFGFVACPLNGHSAARLARWCLPVTPSPSISSVPVSRAISASRARSAFERASRDTSRPSTAPTSPRQTRDISSRNPCRCAADVPERPRSRSVTSTSRGAQPSLTAVSASAYCRIVDSVCSRTWTRADWRR